VIPVSLRKQAREYLDKFYSYEWWQIVGQIIAGFMFLGFGMMAVGFLLRLNKAFTHFGFLLFLGGMSLIFLFMLIVLPFTSKKPFIPDDILDPEKRRDTFEWNLGVFGIFILLFAGSLWMLETALFYEGKVPSGWIFFFGILWVGSALVMWTPWVRDRIDQYYKENTLEDAE